MSIGAIAKTIALKLHVLYKSIHAIWIRKKPSPISIYMLSIAL